MKNRTSSKLFAVTLALLLTVGATAVPAYATGDSSPDEAISTTLNMAPPSSEPEGGSGGNVGKESAPTDSVSPPASSEPEAVSSSPEEPSSSPQSSSSQESSSSQKSSSSKSSSSKAVSSKPTRSVDTKENQINQRASQAQQAVSDPDVLSSQDWSELLSSEPSSGSSALAAGVGSGTTSTSSTPSNQGGGVSVLLISGIILIVLGVAGIGFFVYEQFFAQRSGRRGGYIGPMDISSHSHGSSMDDTEPLEFEDISSNSDGHKPNGKITLEDLHPAGTIPTGTGKAVKKAPSQKQPPKPTAKPAVKKAHTGDQDPTILIPKDVAKKAEPHPASHKITVPKRETSAAPAQDTANRPKSQATPVHESNFDWEKFFNEDDD
ncbi:MAG: hypothetical protein E7518_05330 [Ruminococcaceae bacterium]|nr:hypothetical protein [Oscillospiraceae bacterium]HHV31577.1 hypothetical protein [Clostridiales bacterium]